MDIAAFASRIARGFVSYSLDFTYSTKILRHLQAWMAYLKCASFLEILIYFQGPEKDLEIE